MTHTPHPFGRRTLARFLAATLACQATTGYGGDRAATYFHSHGLQDEASLSKIRERGGYFASMVPSVPASYRRLQDGMSVRIGQHESRHRRAVKVWDRREFRNLDDRVEIGTRNIKVALRRLRRFARQGTPDELDMIEHYPTRAEKLADLWVHIVGLMLAAVGGIIGHQSGRGLEGAAIGGALGGVGGAVVGDAQDKRNEGYYRDGRYYPSERAYRDSQYYRGY